MGITQRKFKSWKRNEFKQISEAIRESDILFDAAGLPQEQYRKLIKGIRLIEEARKELAPWWKGA